VHLESIDNPGVKAILADPRIVCRIWVGPGAHVVFYSLRNHSVFNLVLIVADKKFNSSEGDSAQMCGAAPLKSFMKYWDST
jgi:hypothetical protein